MKTAGAMYLTARKAQESLTTKDMVEQAIKQIVHIEFCIEMAADQGLLSHRARIAPELEFYMIGHLSVLVSKGYRISISQFKNYTELNISWNLKPLEVTLDIVEELEQKAEAAIKQLNKKGVA